MPKMRKPSPDGAVSVRGFWRVQLVEHDTKGTPRITGDSEWVKNQITIDGLRLFVGHPMAAQAGSQQILRAALGTGTTPSSTATSLPGEFGDGTGASSASNRASTPTVATASTAVGLYAINYSFMWTWLSTGGFASGATKALGNIGLFANSNTGGTLFAGATFATSQLSNNQDVQATYVVRVGI